jgi:hypothetical protein
MRWDANQSEKPGNARLFRFAGDAGKQAIGGEAGIRTLGTLSGTPHFECGAFDHSATSPQKVRRADGRCVPGRAAAISE